VSCPECGAEDVFGGRTVCLQGKGIHAKYGICAQCAEMMGLGAILQIVENFNQVIDHLVSVAE
jgi:transcription elongation factor Elf1